MQRSLLRFWATSTVLIFVSSIYCSEDETIPYPPRPTPPLRERLYQKVIDGTKSTSEALKRAGRTGGRPFGLGKHPYEKKTLDGLTRREQYEQKKRGENIENTGRHLDLSRRSYKEGYGFGYGYDKKDIDWGFLKNGKLEFSTKHQDPILGDMEKIYNVAEHRGRRQGAYNTALTSAAIGVVGYGLYGLYNWYRGNLHALKKHIKAAESNIDNAIKNVAKENAEGSKILITDIHNAKAILQKIYKSIEEEEKNRKNSK